MLDAMLEQRVHVCDTGITRPFGQEGQSQSSGICYGISHSRPIFHDLHGVSMPSWGGEASSLSKVLMLRDSGYCDHKVYGCLAHDVCVSVAHSSKAAR